MVNVGNDYDSVHIQLPNDEYPLGFVFSSDSCLVMPTYRQTNTASFHQYVMMITRIAGVE